MFRFNIIRGKHFSLLAPKRAGKIQGFRGIWGIVFLKPKGPQARIQGIQGILRNSFSKPKDHLGPLALKLGSKFLFLPPCWFIIDPIVSQFPKDLETQNNVHLLLLPSFYKNVWTFSSGSCPFSKFLALFSDCLA